MIITSKPAAPATSTTKKKRRSPLTPKAKDEPKAAPDPVNATPKKIGRPRIGTEVATVGVTILTTPEERESWRARANGQPLSSWLRALINASK